MSPQTMPSETEIRANRVEDAEDARLRTDIRLLGRILGDTVRDQEGADVFDLVERIRQTSIRFHRDDDKPARRELELILDSMSISQTLRIVRAFSYFSHLANIAEDQNNIRQMRARPRPAGAPRAEHAGADAGACARRRHQRRRSAQFFETAQVSPVLTAHPTEVRRKSTIDREMEIAALLDRRERVQLTPEEAEASDEQLRRAVLTLWQTNLLRRTKLTVLDEVANGLSFYDYTFLHEVPRLHCALEDRLNEGDSAPRRTGLLPEDGKLDRRRPRRQSVRDRRRHARHAETAVEPGAALLSGRTARARRRTVAGGASGRRLQGSARARRTLAGQVAASQRRALSAGGIRHLCAADRDRGAARGGNHPRGGRRGGALRQCRRNSRPISIRSIAR